LAQPTASCCGKVELPAALPTIMAGLTQCIMLSLSMVVFAALIGAGGLGTEVNRALNNGPRGIPLGVEAGLAIVVLAIILDRMTRIGLEASHERRRRFQECRHHLRR
jgi:glycine betaine/proline transport system permease protein